MDTFRVRLNCIDHYQSQPTHFDPYLPLQPQQPEKGVSQSAKLPIIRVFGATESGQKVCAHIHGVFPYLFIEYEGNLDPGAVIEYIETLRTSINYALALSYRRNPEGPTSSFVAHISLVKGTPFYGFHIGYKAFLKVSLFNPSHITRFADLLRQGAVLRRSFQPFESHIQYLAQWMCDYNLFGCAYLDCKKVMFREPVPHEEETKVGHEWHSASVPESWVERREGWVKQSHCAIEVDIRLEDITNRGPVRPRELHHEFVERKFPIPPETKFVTSMAGLWKDEAKRRREALGVDGESQESAFPPEVLVSVSAELERESKGGWIHEAELEKKIEKLIENERKLGEVSFEKFVVPKQELDGVQTVLESIEELYPGRFETFKDQFDGDSAQDKGLEIVSKPTPENGHTNPFSPSTPSSNEIFKVPGSYPSFEGNDFEDAADPGSEEFLQANTADTIYSFGIRDHGDLSYYDGDLFPIPAGFQSIIPRGQALPPTPVPISALSSPSRHKRQKLSESGRKSKCSVSFDMPTSLQRQPQASQGTMSSQESIKVTSGSTIRAYRATKSSQNSQPKAPAKKETESRQPNTFPSNESSTCTTHEPFISSQVHELSQNLFPAFGLSPNAKILLISTLPPPSSTPLPQTHLPVIYTPAHYSDESDVPVRARSYAGREFKLESFTVPFLPVFDASGLSAASRGDKPPFLRDRKREEIEHQRQRSGCSLRCWEIAAEPPSRLEVVKWLERSQEEEYKTNGSKTKARLKSRSQIEGPTPKHPLGDEISPSKRKNPKPGTTSKNEVQYMSVMSLETHVNTRGELLPDPNKDEVKCIFWALRSEEVGMDVNCHLDGTYVGIIAVDRNSEDTGVLARHMRAETQLEVDVVTSELDLLDRLVEVVRILDPDILTGYEVHGGSWGYLIERARIEFDLNLCDDFSRVKENSHGRFGKENDRWGFNNTSTVRVTGRHMINVWRAMQAELGLLQYTLENVALQLLGRRVPRYRWRTLTEWFECGRAKELGRVLDYHLSRCLLNLEILEKTEIVPRISEQARLLGVDFFSVISRGSQFKVESLVSRVAKPENLLLISPDRRQVGSQNALECLPLVMEPQSNFYNSPVLVLDFQSLYPSIMIAYNYCYSTFLGRVDLWRGQNKMGFTDYRRPDRILELLKSQINISPNGMMYCKPTIRKSLLAKMLGEILETRVMVKSGMKIEKEDKQLQRLLNNRQLALKLIANVTYGYTSASFSGRMPCSEIADSIVQTGRETLEKTIALIHSVDRWGAEVVYGDTDSLFVCLKGRTKEEAFEIGADIAKTVTNKNPRPVKLKFEKVYLPCVLLAKKRYVGYKYEHKDQKVPEFDAKGIETVRRDGTPAEQKIEERALKILFETADLSQVKIYFQRQCDKIMKSNVSIQDFCFAKEVRLGTYSEKGPPPPGALISTRKMLADPRAEPQYGERVPYVVITGAPGARLIDRCVAPEVLLEDDQIELDAEYYISKNLIPPLERIFNLVGANVRSWYDEMPKTQRVRAVAGPAARDDKPTTTAAAAMLVKDSSNALVITKKTLESYLKTSICLVCRQRIEKRPKGQAADAAELPLCHVCFHRPDAGLVELRRRQAATERAASNVTAVCRSCSGLVPGEEVKCDSRDCSVFYTRVGLMTRLRSEGAVQGPVIRALERVTDRLAW
ncbi:MAG: DNA polymerase zeta [Vezdaea aestivalis]|nr:MAG: DNA polymerase zeta [Vezdaea aestivalis]